MIMQPLRQHHLLMVHMELGASPHFPLPVERGMVLTINASYLDARTGQRIADTTLHLTGPQELHFMASHKERFAGWWYLQEWDRTAKLFKCSCYEARCCGFCSHIEALDPAFTVA